MLVTIASKLGAIGLVTDGGVRDLEGVRALGFQFFSPGMTPAHGRFQIVDVGVPVVVSEVEVLPGDLVHGDENGVVNIPLEIADEVPQAAAKIATQEKQIMDFAKSDDFSLEGVRKLIVLE